MNKKYYLLTASICIFLLILLITDPKTAADSAQKGIELSLKVLIPSLFPFFLITTYTNSVLSGHSLPGLQKIRSILKMPLGAENILLLGFLGGYPVGAKLTGQLYENRKISKTTGQIMLGYCSNAGPAFIFGVTRILFSNPWIPFLLWCIHILSAMITGYMLPKPKHKEIISTEQVKISLTNAMNISIQTCATVCGWVITFQILQGYLTKLFERNKFILLLQCFLELSSGCIALQELNSEPIRFILVSSLLSFGGACVLLQTMSVVGSLGIGYYILGKLMQTGFSLLFSGILSAVFMPKRLFLTIIIIAVVLILCPRIIMEKTSGNSSNNHV